MAPLNAKVELDVPLSKEELFEIQRQNLWAQAWVSTASSNDCKDSMVATRWADAALQAFDNRFNK